MAILIIGGAGYIGSHTAKVCKNRGLDVVIFDSLELGHREAVERVGVPFVHGDYGNYRDLDKAIRAHNIDAVMHFGAYASVGDSVIDPSRYYESNIAGGLTLLRAVLDNGIKNFIFSSSAATYGEPQILPIPENHPQKTTNPYGETKLMYERIPTRLRPRFWFEIGQRSATSTRRERTHEGRYGRRPYTPKQHILPLIIDTALGRRDSEVKIFGTDWDTRDGTCLRDFVHIVDLADAHIRALEYLRKGGRNDQRLQSG